MPMFGPARAAFRALLARDGVTVMPGGFSPILAVIAEAAGFEAFFVAGSQMSTYLLGVPDVGIIGLRDVADHVRHVAARVRIPVMVDADTGFGNAVNVHYTVQELARSGAAAMQIEDQEAPKKSGTSAGRRCIPLDEAAGKIRAALAARDEIDPAFAICARCDAIGAAGETFEDALRRCVAYAEAGADLVWINAIDDREALARVCREVAAPVLAGWGGTEAGPTFAEYEQLGVRIALYPTIAATIGMQAAWEMLHDFRARGTVALTERAAAAKASPWGRFDRRVHLGYGRLRELEAAYLPAELQREYGDER